jgi:hypothetical protein
MTRRPIGEGNHAVARHVNHHNDQQRRVHKTPAAAVKGSRHAHKTNASDPPVIRKPGRAGIDGLISFILAQRRTAFARLYARSPIA